MPRALLLASILALAPALGRAGELEINPVRVSLGANERSTVVKLRNQGQAAGRFEVKVYAWAQTAAGEMKLEPTTDVVVYPTRVTLAPGDSRNLRVGAGIPFGGVEKAYRLFIEELPAPAKQDATAGVQVLARFGLPVFLVPARIDERVEVAGLVTRDGRVDFTVANRGNVHVRPEAVTLVALDAAGGVVLERALAAWYVLAGGERAYQVELPGELCVKVSSVAVEVKLTPAPVRASAPATCAP